MSHSRPTSPVDPTSVGLLYALGAFLLWGISPLYFNLLRGVPAYEILAHRIVWSVALMAVLVLFLRGPSAVAKELASRRRLGVYAMTTALVSANWLIFIWAVNNGHIVEASLGYYINPLVNVLLGVAFLGERLTRRQSIAIALAVVGVSSMIAGVGKFPWIALTLAFTFGFYALVRKKEAVDPLTGLLVETSLLAPAAATYLFWAELVGIGALGQGGPGFGLLLVMAGAVTSVPLVLFMYGAQRLKLSTIGLMQYIAPTVQLLLGVFINGESFTTSHGIAFAFIWGGLAVFSSDILLRSRSLQKAA